MATSGFSALMPSVLRVRAAPDAAELHLAASVTTPLADWGRAVRSENDAACALDALEPLLLLLSVAGYAVPEVVFAGAGVARQDLVSIVQAAFEIRRGTPSDWTPVPFAAMGLRVCPIAAAPVDLSAELAGYKPGFGTRTAGWLVLPVNEADLPTSIDDLVNGKLWAPLASKIAKASAGSGVAALVDAARNLAPTDPRASWAALPDVAANAMLALQSLKATGMLEAEFLAERAGKRLSQQMAEVQAKAEAAAAWLAPVQCRSRLGSLAESVSSWWSGTEAEDPAESDEAPAAGWLEWLGYVRALLVSVGTTEVTDAAGAATGPGRPAHWPLSALMDLRGSPELARAADWSASESSSMVKRKPDGCVAVTIEEFTFRRNPAWQTFAAATTPYPLLAQEQQKKVRLTHTLDFARCWFDHGDEQTTYAISETSIEAYLLKAGNEALLARVDALRVVGKKPETDAKRQGSRAAAFKLLLVRGDADLKACWCSGFTLLTLASAGYDLEYRLVGRNGEEHGYVDGDRGWTPIKLSMLIDGQPEATAAMAAILGQTTDGKLASVDGLGVFLPKGDTGSIRNFAGVPVKDRKFPEEGQEAEGKLVKDDVAITRNKPAVGAAACAYRNAANFEADTYGKDTDTSKDYADSLAVRMGPGAIEMVGLGTGIKTARIRPGDVAQRLDTETLDGKIVYDGKGHAFQIWAVRGRLLVPVGQAAQVTMAAGSTKDAAGRDLVELDRDSVAASWIDDGIELTACRFIEANVSGSVQGLAKSKSTPPGDGGVSISKWHDLPLPNEARCRYYFARLHESPWSEARLAAATAAAAGKAP